VISTDIHNFIRSKYKEHKETGKSTIKFPDVKHDVETKKRIIEKKLTEKYPIRKDGFYSCGHKIKPVIINTSSYTLSVYCEWLNDNPNDFCLDCWIKNRNISVKTKLFTVESKINQLKHCIFGHPVKKGSTE